LHTISPFISKYDIAFDNLTSAFIGGTGDFVTAFEPAASQIVASGNGHIVASVGAETGEIPYTAFTANRSYINANEETIKNFLRAIIKGYNYLISSNINDVVSALKPSFDGTTDEMLRISVEAYKNIDAWSRTPVMSSVAYNNLMNIIINSETLTTAVDMNKVVDNTYAQTVLADFI
jgi:NitT/TauT family transport system substrate-binding protein